MSEMKQVDQYAQAISSIPAIVDRYIYNKLGEAIHKAIQSHNAECRKEAQAEKHKYIELVDSTSTYDAVASLSDYELTKILLDKMKESKSHLKVDYKKELYDALVKPRDKKRKSSKEVESQKDPRSKEGRSSSSSKDTSHSHHKSSGKSARVEEPSHTVDESGVQKNQEFDTGNNDEQPDDEAAPKNDCIIACAEKPPTSFDELTDTPIDFSTFVMNRLNITNLTQELLVGPTFNLLKEGKPYPFDLRKPLPLIQDHRGRQVIPQDYFINNDLEYLKGESLSRKYSTFVTNTNAATYEIKWIKDLVPNLWSLVKVIIIQKRVGDLQLGVESYQKKINLTKPDIFRNKDEISAKEEMKWIRQMKGSLRIFKNFLVNSKNFKFTVGIKRLHDDLGVTAAKVLMKRWQVLGLRLRVGSAQRKSIGLYNMDVAKSVKKVKKAASNKKRKVTKQPEAETIEAAVSDIPDEVHESKSTDGKRDKKTSKSKKKKRDKESRKKDSARKNVSHSDDADQQSGKLKNTSQIDNAATLFDDEDEVYEMSSGDEDETTGMKRWITKYHRARPGAEVLMENINDFLVDYAAHKEREKKEREEEAAEGGWTVVGQHKGRKKTTEAESGTTVGSVAPAAVMDKLSKKKDKQVGLNFYRFQKREAQRNGNKSTSEAKLDAVQPGPEELIASGAAGAFAKTAVAPLERIKILLQTHTQGFHTIRVYQSLKRILKHEGLLGFYKGNGASVLLIVSYAALHFMTYEQYRCWILDNYTVLRTGPGVDLLAGSGSWRNRRFMHISLRLGPNQTRLSSELLHEILDACAVDAKPTVGNGAKSIIAQPDYNGIKSVLQNAASEWFKKDCIGSVTTWDNLVEKFVQKFYQLSDHNEEIEEDDDPDDIIDIFKIEGNLFDFKTPLDLEESWLDNGVPYQLCDHICEPYRFKNGVTKWPTCSSDIDGFCNGELPRMVRVGSMTYFQDHKWYDELADGKLKEETLMHKAKIKESWGDATPDVMKFCAWLINSFGNFH
ncbi:ribosomal RNA-processing protein 7 [Tanacetum coccineum]